MRTVVMMAAMVAILAVFVVVDADARLANSWLDIRVSGHLLIETSDTPFVISNDGGRYAVIDYSNPARPQQIVSNFDDVVDGSYVIVFERDGSEYMIVASSEGRSIRIIDITNINRPEVLSTAAYGDAGWDALEQGAGQNNVFEKDGRLYALVHTASGTMILDINNPANMRPISLISYSYLMGEGGARAGGDRNTVELDGSTYVIMPSKSPSGAAAVDITDLRNPEPTGSPIFYIDGKNAFAWIESIGTFTDDAGSTFAVTVSSSYKSLNIFNITDPANIVETSKINLDERTGRLKILEQDGRTYVVLKTAENIRTFDVTDPYNPVSLAIFAPDKYDFGIQMFDVVDISGEPHLLHAGKSGFVYAHDLSDPANPVEITPAIAGGFYAAGDLRDVVVTDINDSTYVLAVGHDEGGAMQVIKIHDHGQVEAVAAMFRGMNGFGSLYKAWGIDTARINGVPYAVVAGERDGGSVMIIDVSDPTRPESVSSIFDDDNGFDHLGDPWDVATAEIGGRHYAITASRGDNAVQIIDITDPSSPRPAGYVAAERNVETPTTQEEIEEWMINWGSSDGLKLWPQYLKVVYQDGRTYVVVLAARDDYIQMIDITNPNRPEVTGSTRVTGATSIDTTIMDGRTFALVAGNADDGGGKLTILEINAGSISYASKLPVPWNNVDPILATGFGTGAAADGDTALYVDGSGSYIIDISDPYSPRLGDYSAQQGGDAVVHTVGNITYMMTFSSHGLGISEMNEYGDIYRLGGFNDGRVTAISDPITAVRAVFDGRGGFETLAGANSIAAIKTHGGAYILAGGSEGIQVINVDDPYHPSPATAITDITVLDMQLVSGRYLVAETIDGVMAFNVTNPASPVQIVVNTGLTDISADDGDDVQRMDSDVIYLSGESRIASIYSDGSIKVARGFDIDTQRLNSLLAVENATAAALFEIGGKNYGVVAAIGYYHVSSAEYHDDAYERKLGNLLVYDTTDPHDIVSLISLDEGSDGSLIGRDPLHLETFGIAGKNFALILYPDRFNMADISDPYNPVKILGGGSGDDSSNFRALAGASDFDIMVIDGRLYGMVAAPDDDGIQIMDLTYLALR